VLIGVSIRFDSHAEAQRAQREEKAPRFCVSLHSEHELAAAM